MSQKNSSNSSKTCANCKTDESVLFRKVVSKDGAERLMCNKCALYLKRHGIDRPIEMPYKFRHRNHSGRYFGVQLSQKPPVGGICKPKHSVVDKVAKDSDSKAKAIMPSPIWKTQFQQPAQLQQQQQKQPNVSQKQQYNDDYEYQAAIMDLRLAILSIRLTGSPELYFAARELLKTNVCKYQ